MIGTPKELIRWLLEQNPEKRFEVEEHHEKRSLQANAYAWVLVQKIADVIRASKQEVYLQMLESYGQSMLVPLPHGDSPEGFFKYYEYVTTKNIGGTDADWYRVYKGSSEYNSREMAILIDGIVSECKDLDIETLPEDEIRRLKEAWI